MMKKLNILAIDDEVQITKDLLFALKENSDVIGEIIVDNTMLRKIADLENYDPFQYGINIDVVFIDYQLECEFTGKLVSACMLIHQIKAPRIALTGAEYPYQKDFFDANILKHDISVNPERVIQTIVNCVNNFDYEHWLTREYEQLVNEYTIALSDNKADLSLIEIVLDKFEKILDAKQEEDIKTRIEMITLDSGYSDKHERFIKEMNDYQTMINKYKNELEK